MKDLRAIETGGRNSCKMHLSTMLPSLNNRFCKPRVIFVGLEIGNTRQRRLFSFLLSSLSARENCDVANENETTVTGKRARKMKEERRKREKLIKKERQTGELLTKDGQRKTEKELHNGTYTVHDADH